MWAKAWPNGMGWDVGTNAEVVKLEKGLGVRIITKDGRVKSLFIPDPNLDPVRAVRRCWRKGKFEEE
jgi:hypothetical protein